MQTIMIMMMNDNLIMMMTMMIDMMNDNRYQNHEYMLCVIAIIVMLKEFIRCVSLRRLASFRLHSQV